MIQRVRFGFLFLVSALTACGGGGQLDDPVVKDFPIAYVVRPVPTDDDGEVEQTDLRRPETFNPGAVLLVRDNASPGATERAITDRVFPAGSLYDVKDVEASFDGGKFVFAMRAPEIENADEEDQPRWNIWEYDIGADSLRRIIGDDAIAEDGHDIAPHYLPDGRIVFSSTRQHRSRAILLDENKTQFAALDEDRRVPAFVLHVISSNGNDLNQISFNQSHDLAPSILSTGEVLFSRWDGAGQRSAINLYTMRPDGTEMALHYGVHSHNTGTDGSTIQFVQPRELPNGQVLAIIKPFRSDRYGGAAVFIDTENYTDQFQQNGIGVVVDGAQSIAVGTDVRTDDAPSPGGRYGSVYPLWDGTGRLLVSWTPCRLLENELIVACTDERLQDPAAEEAAPLYGIWIYDSRAGTQLPVVIAQENFIFTDIAAAHPRATPVALVDKSSGIGLDPGLFDEGVGILNIRSVYDYGGVDTASPNVQTLADPALTTSADDRPARFLRVVKAVSIPDDDVRDFDRSAFGPNVNQLMREIVGYAPIEPDGSIRIKVPADVPLAIEVLDTNGRRIGGRHQNWIQLRPGEVRNCNGCHTAGSEVAHGRPEVEFPSINAGSQLTGQPFPNTVERLWTDAGETMAETRTRHSESADCTVDCQALTPSPDLIYKDVWTDPAVRAPDTDFSYRYAGLTTPAPDANCPKPWGNRCRILIHYEAHIHPIWSVIRPDPADTCTACHVSVDVNNANAPRIPDAQLDLSDDGPADNDDRFRAYGELFFADDEQFLDETGTLVDVMEQVGVDESGVPVFGPVTAVPGPSMSAAGAGQSSFFSIFDAGGSHAGRLTSDELRLIAEWLDIGAQYYNSPFDAPLN